jgi:FkbM family methyltransferase
MDAVNALRMGSGNRAIDKELWRETFFDGESVHPGHCRQEFAPQFVTPDLADVQRDGGAAAVHCVEAMPVTANRLNITANRLGWASDLRVVHAAMASDDGSMFFPNVKDKVGIENMGFDDCKRNKSGCTQVVQHRLDTCIEQFIDRTSPIDFLSIDVEGYDWEVLRGAEKTLSRIQCLEFEHNWRGTWQKCNLSTAVNELKRAGFMCYWAGTNGNIWRITDCWLDFYDLKFWSNVACVNIKAPAAKELALRMEEIFRTTLEKGKTVRFNSPTSS